MKNKTELDDFFKLYGGILNKDSIAKVLETNKRDIDIRATYHFRKNINNCKYPKYFLHMITKADSIVTMCFKNKHDCQKYSDIILSRLLLGIDVVSQDLKANKTNDWKLKSNLRIENEIQIWFSKSETENKNEFTKSDWQHRSYLLQYI